MLGDETAEESKGQDETEDDEGYAPSLFANHHQELSDTRDEQSQDDGCRDKVNPADRAFFNHIKQTSSTVIAPKEAKKDDRSHLLWQTNPLNWD